MAIVRNFNLFLNAGHSIPLVINANQYDQGESWVFTLFNSDGTQYVPSTGAIVGIKSDGLGIINSGSVVDGKVVITETQQMTAAPGKAVFELMIDSGTHGTANFIVLVEPKPGNNADLSDSDLSLIQEALDAVNPLPTGGSVGQVLTKTASGSAWSDAGTPTQEQVAEAVSDWADENITVTTGVVIDQSLSVQGAAADAKKTGDEISELKSAIEQSSGLTSAIKSALLQIAQKVVYVDDGGQTYYDDLYDALYPPIVVTAITLSANSLSFGTLNSTQQLTATTTPVGGEVVWSSSNTSVATVSATGLVTAVAYGNATITATSGNVSATCSVAITQATVTSISAVYTQSGTVYADDSLDVLKSDLVVTATWSNQTTSVVASDDYTLSGTLTEGTSTITVSYGGKTTTFTVTVSGSKFAVSYAGNFTTSTPMSTRYTLITSELTLAYGETLTLSIASGYKVFSLTAYGTGSDTSISRTAKSANQIRIYGINNGSSYVYPTSAVLISSGSNVTIACSANDWVNGSGTITYSIANSAVSSVTFDGIGFYVDKIDGSDITEAEAKNAVSWTIS